MSSRELTQTSNRASAGLALRTESRASVLVAPTWRDFSQMRRCHWSLIQAAWVGRHQEPPGKSISVVIAPLGSPSLALGRFSRGADPELPGVKGSWAVV